MRALLLFLTLLPSALLLGDDKKNPLGVKMEFAPGGAADNSLLHFTLSLDIGALTFVKQGGDENYRAEFVMQFEAVPYRGRAVPIETRRQTLTITEEELNAPGTDFAHFLWQIDVSPLRFPDSLRKSRERMRLRVTIEEPSSGRRSVIYAPMSYKKKRLFDPSRM